MADQQQRNSWEEWWSQDQQQSLLHHQQTLAAQHAAAAAAAAHQHPASTAASAAAAHQLFSYKMAASNFQNLAAAAAATTPVSSPGGGYDYRMPPAASNHAAAAAAAAAGQWWYPPQGGGMDSGGGGGHGGMQNTQSPNMMNRSRMPRVAKADAKPRGRMTAYAFFVQICREEHKKKHPEENVVFAEFSKKCAERWKTMSDKEKKRFHEMADKDKKRYDTEMQSYVPPKGEKVRGKKRKHTKDPNAPKRSLSAFFWFCNDERGKVKAANPLYGVGDIAKELGRRWAMADSTMKSKYDAMAEKDKARYEREMTEYKNKGKLPMMTPQNMTIMPKKDEEMDEDEDEEEEEEDGDE